MNDYKYNQVPKFLSAFESELKKLNTLVDSAKEILVTTHQRPDSDAVGSVLAMAQALTQKGKNVTVHTPDKPPEFLS
jgi:phosphoesterase RecJ-like protein